MGNQAPSAPLPEPPTPVRRRPRPRRLFVMWAVPVAVVLVVVLLAVVLLSARSAPPPGASGTGVAYVNSSKGVTAVRVSDGHLLWTSPASSGDQPLSDQGVVFLEELGDQGIYPVALRATDGTTLWHTETLAGYNPRLTAAAGVLYFTANFRPAGQSSANHLQPAILALRGSDGHLLWRYDAPAPIVSAPVVVDGTVFVGVGTTLVALQGSDGTPRWQVPLPLPKLPAGEELVAGNGGLYAYVQDEVLGTIFDGNAVAPTQVFALRAADGSETWQVSLGNQLAFTGAASVPVLVKGVLYFLVQQLGDQPQTTLLALSARDGSQLWSDAAPLQRRLIPYLTGPFFSNGALYFSDVASYVEAVRASDGKLLWKQPFDFSVSLILLATQEMIVVQIDNDLLGLRASDGTRLWQLPHLY